MKRILFILFAFLFIPIFSLKAQSYPGVWFENSGLPLSYSNGKVSYGGKSWIKNIKRNLPLSDSVFFTPSNALELNYVSAEEGKWKADIHYPRQEAFMPMPETVLSLKVFVQSETSVDQLPALEIIQRDSVHSSLVSLKGYIHNYQQNMWLSVDIPLKEIIGINFEMGIQSIRLLQNSSDGKEHLIYIDQIEILPKKVPENILTGAAVLSSVKAYEKHVDITWQLPLTPNIRYIKVYRSLDNQHFDAIAIRPIYARRYSDIIPKTDTTYYYKIAWVDYQYRESPFSEVKKAKPQKLDDDALLDMVQNANIKYFVDGEEFNSGMQLKNRYARNATVSVENTGVGILALLVGVEKGAIPKEQVLKRIEKIVSFLKHAESIQGAFPELLDGRTGNAIGSGDSAHVYVNLESTMAMMQGLLVARQYFNQKSDAEEALRKKITDIWKAVEWNSFVKPGTHYLYTNWSREEDFKKAIPLSGQSKLSLYIMAIASPKFNIGLDAYMEAATRPFQLIQKDSIKNDSIPDDKEMVVDSSNSFNDHMDSLMLSDSIINLDYQVVQYKNNNTYYGIPLAVGSEHANLLDILLGFIAFDPRNKQDDFTNYFENTVNLIHIQHREALESPRWGLLKRSKSISFAGSTNESMVFSPAQGIAIYPFYPALAMEDIKDYYRYRAELLWREYGFIRAINLEKDHIVYPENGLENALIAVMIENGKSGFIWNLYMKDPDIAKVVKDLFKPLSE